MKRFVCSVSILLGTFVWLSCSGAYENRQHLFFIERSKNKNIVQYDVHTTQEGDLAGRAPVFVYWILENGERRELSKFQKNYAYGIDSQERLEHNRYEIVLTALRERKITVKETNDGYRAFVLINGREGILERIFVESKKGIIGLPKVVYVDLVGEDTQSAIPVTERIFLHD